MSYFPKTPEIIRGRMKYIYHYCAKYTITNQLIDGIVTTDKGIETGKDFSNLKKDISEGTKNGLDVDFLVIISLSKLEEIKQS